MKLDEKAMVWRIIAGAVLAVCIALASWGFWPAPAPGLVPVADSDLRQEVPPVVAERPEQPATETPSPELAAPELAAQEPAAQEPVSPETVSSEPTTADASAQAAAPQTEALVPPAPTPPAFDTFRVEADGAIVVAGRAEPGQTVDLMLAGSSIARTEADSGGRFVVFAQADPSDMPRSLSLLADPDGAALASRERYIVAPFGTQIAAMPDVPPDVATAALPAPVADNGAVDTPPDTAAPATAPAMAPAAAQSVEVAQTPAAPTVLQADAAGVTVIQTPDAAVSNVALDAITYDPAGEVSLSGRATGDGEVQVYVDNAPVSRSPVSQGGGWRTDLPDVATGVYTLRIDEIDEGGTVVSRIETPFRREEADQVAAVMAEQTAQEGFDVAVRTVQPGSTLWAIAEEAMGAGILYVEVFEANRDLIRDPDLIYPGQIFRMPERQE